ncbi:STAS domain-containing protein [Planktotalea arctica]|uniref:STAS domain-containing protein n=1 Tax=Planktotalea arctica TaxID=1481893 RepID=UPI000A172E73|nr:STAS domain-containing protein [Planktotalea arctica]
MNMSSEIAEDLQIIKILEKRIDAAAAIQFKDRVRELTAEQVTPVVLDLSEVDFVDSSGLGAIVATMKFLGSERPLHLAGLTPIVAKVFALTRMERVFKIFQSPVDAVKSYEAKRA